MQQEQQQQQAQQSIGLSLESPLEMAQPPEPPRRRPRRSRRRAALRAAQLRVYEPQPQPHSQFQLHQQELQQPQQQQQQQDLQLQTRVTHFTDFDKAYFDCYAHLGVHEEMIKVSFQCFLSSSLLLLLFLLVSFFVFSVVVSTLNVICLLFECLLHYPFRHALLSYLQRKIVIELWVFQNAGNFVLCFRDSYVHFTGLERWYHVLFVCFFVSNFLCCPRVWHRIVCELTLIRLQSCIISLLLRAR